jgi:TolA-binding protein
MRAIWIVLLMGLAAGLTCLATAPACGAPAASPGAIKAPDAAADDPNAEPPAQKPAKKPKGEETGDDKIEAQLGAIQERLTQLMNEEMNLTISLMEMQQKANQLIENPDKAADELSKGLGTPKLREYKAILMQSASRLQALDAKYVSLIKTMKGLEKDRQHAEAQQQARIDELSTRVAAKHKANVEKIATYYERVGQPRIAIGIYIELYQSLPESKRDRNLKEKIAAMSEKCGDAKSALVMYKAILDAVPEKDRHKERALCDKLSGLYEKGGDTKAALGVYQNFIPEKECLKDRALCEKMGGMYEKIGDAKAALAMYRAALEAIPPDKRDTDGKGLKDKIASIEKKSGGSARQPSRRGT